MKAWLQSADLSVREFDADVSTAVAALETHDWSGEKQWQRELESAGKASCPAGLGLVRDDGRILHICPDGDNALVHLHRTTRLLGFLWSTRKVLTQPSTPVRRLEELVRYFFSKYDAGIERIF